jgi:hypothetical protein
MNHSRTRHPFDDPQPGDIIGWTAEMLGPGEPPHTRTVLKRSSISVVYRDSRHEGEKACLLKTWRSWALRNIARCISQNHLHPDLRCYCLGRLQGDHNPNCPQRKAS